MHLLQLVKTLDRQLIKTMKHLCDFRKGDPSSVMLPPPVGMIPGALHTVTYYCCMPSAWSRVRWPLSMARPRRHNSTALALALRGSVPLAPRSNRSGPKLTGLIFHPLHAVTPCYRPHLPSVTRRYTLLHPVTGLIFHLRRSPAVRTTGFSPDETAYFRLLVTSLSVYSTLVLVQPALLAYDVGRAPTPMPLEPTVIGPQRSLLLDTFLQVCTTVTCRRCWSAPPLRAVP